jgi:hypothetical protein
MRTLILIAFMVFLINTDGYTQKPEWVDNPGIYANENFVGVGIAKDKKVDKAREKAEKKAKKGVEKILKNKYKDKEIKKAMPALKFESYWQDPETKYYYCLALLPKEEIDKNYATKKKFEKAKSSAMDATDELKLQTSEDIIIINVDDEEEK